MAVTFGEAKNLLAQFAGRGGKCPNTQEVYLFVKQVLQYMLYSGTYGNLRKFCFNAVDGCFTAPFELEVPLKVKIDSNVGTVWSKWHEFYNYGEMEGCVPASDALYEEPNLYPTVYELPSGGARVGALATACEEVNAYLIVQGLDPSGREVITNHEGKQVVGEYLRLRKGILRYTQVAFGKITAIEKSKTNGYVQLFWVNSEATMKGFLADYSPLEEKPQYRRFKLTTQNCGSNCSTCLKVSVLARIRLKDNYADNDIIPFDNLYAISIAGQAVQAQFNGDAAQAQAKDQMMQDLIARESEYKRVSPGQPVDIFYPLSGGSITNIV